MTITLKSSKGYQAQNILRFNADGREYLRYMNFIYGVKRIYGTHKENVLRQPDACDAVMYPKYTVKRFKALSIFKSGTGIFIPFRVSALNLEQFPCHFALFFRDTAEHDDFSQHL